MHQHRISALLLAALLALSACGTPADPPADTTALSAPETAAPALVLTDFVITRADEDMTIVPALQDLRERIEDISGVALSLATDYVHPGLIEEPAYEILLGKTAREASTAVYDTLEPRQWGVVRDGTKIVIAGHNRDALASAVNWFCAHYFTDGSFTVPSDTAHYDEFTYQVYHDILSGIRFNVIGDSYVAHSSLESGRTWAVQLADKYGMDYKGYGQGGNAIASTAASGEPMVTRYLRMRNTADIVMVVGGRNDYNQRHPVGQPTDTTADTFAGALNILIDGLRVKYPDSLILFSTCWYVNETQKAYSDMMLTVCAEKGIPCFNAADQESSKVRMDDAVFRATYCIKPTDVSHLNDAGMELVMPAYEAFIAAEAEKFFAQCAANGA